MPDPDSQENHDAELARRLEVAERELHALLHSISHDVRAPLRVINGFSLALQEDYAKVLEGAGLDHVRRIRAAAARMDQMLDGILRLSRITVKPPESGRVDLSHMARDIVCGLRENTPPHEVEVDVEPGMELAGDRALVRVVLHELIGNAWKYTRGVSGARIGVGRAGAPPGRFAVRVRDNGIGFDSELAGERLFGLFQCFHDREKQPGNGVGLALARRAARVMGGEVEARSKPGEGAEFTCILPDGSAR